MIWAYMTVQPGKPVIYSREPAIDRPGSGGYCADKSASRCLRYYIHEVAWRGGRAKGICVAFQLQGVFG